MSHMDLSLTGVTFTDLALTDVGSSAFQLDHDWFTRQDLVIRTAAGGGGTLLVEGTDYTLSEESTELSERVTVEVGSGRNVFHLIAVTTVGYQTGTLYFSGKYIADSVAGEDVEYRAVKLVGDASYTIRDGDHCGVFVFGTTLTADRTLTLPTAADNASRRIRVMNAQSSAYKVIVDGEGSEAINGTLVWWLNTQYQWLELVCDGTGWVVAGCLGTLLEYTSTSDVSTAAAESTWYNPTSHSVTLEPGIWEVAYTVGVFVQSASGSNNQSKATLSTANNTESDVGNSSHARGAAATSGSLGLQHTHHRHIRLTLAAQTTYYLNIWGESDGTGLSSLTTRGSTVGTRISARRVA